MRHLGIMCQDKPAEVSQVMLDVLAVSNSSMVERQWAIIGSLETPVRSGLSPLLFFFLNSLKVSETWKDTRIQSNPHSDTINKEE